MNKTKIIKAKAVLGAAAFLVLLAFPTSSAQSSANGSAPLSGNDSFGTISGRVTGPDGAAASRIRVHIFQEPAGREYQAETDCSGFYAGPAVEEGNYTIQFAREGFRLENTKGIHVGSNRGAKLDIQMQAGELKGERITIESYTGNVLVQGMIAGTVRDPSTAPIAEAKVWAIAEKTGDLKEATADKNGFFTLLHLPPGRYGVWAVSPGFTPRVARAIAVTADAKSMVDIVLSVGGGSYVEVIPNTPEASEQHVKSEGEIHGMVVDANGLVFARVTATNLSTGKRYDAQVDYTGSYHLTEIPAGNYCTKFEAGGPRYGLLVPEFETSREMRVDPKGRTELNVALPALLEKAAPAK